MTERKVIYIDVSQMTEREMCQLLNVEYIPWYRSTFFWTITLFYSALLFNLFLTILV
jgi:hypothetical protein